MRYGVAIMSTFKEIDRGKQLGEELSTIIRNLPDDAVGELLGHGVLDNLLKAILDAEEAKKYPSIAEFFLANRNRAYLIALLRHAITNNYALKGTSKQGQIGFASPSHVQYFDDGVMLLEGEKPFEGFLALYRNGRVGYAIVSRDARAGEQLRAEHFDFVDLEDFSKIREQVPLNKIKTLDEPVEKLQALLHHKSNDESKYQELLHDYPWVLGAQYRKIVRHEGLDDANIPDFTGIRVHDGDRDIFEIKPPFMKVFTKDGELSNEFHKAWNQAERYLNFVRQEKDYLYRKGRRFDNPKCFLILGYNLSESEIEQLRVKQRITPSIQLFTYNDLLTWMRSTISLVRELQKQDE